MILVDKIKLNVNILVSFLHSEGFKNLAHLTGWGVGEGLSLTRENESRRVESQCHSPRWRVLQKCSFQPCANINFDVGPFLRES